MAKKPCCRAGACLWIAAAVVALLSLLVGLLFVDPPPLFDGEESLPRELLASLSEWPACDDPASHNASNVTVVTVLNEEIGFFPLLRTTAEKVGWNMIALGIGEPWGGFIYRLTKELEALKALDPCAMALVMDGLDTIIYKPGVLASIVPPPGKVLASVDVHHHGLGLKKRQARVTWGHRTGHSLNAGVYLGRAADVARLVTATRFLATRFDVPCDQWALNVMRGGAGPAFQRFFDETVQVDNRKLQVNAANFHPTFETVVAHAAGNARGAGFVLYALGLEPTMPGPPAPDFWERIRHYGRLHCGSGSQWLRCLQGQVFWRGLHFVVWRQLTAACYVHHFSGWWPFDEKARRWCSLHWVPQLQRMNTWILDGPDGFIDNSD